MPEHDRLVDLAFPDPRVLVPAVEDLDGDVFTAPMAEPDLAKPEQDRQSFRDENQQTILNVLVYLTKATAKVSD